jgi:long-subunit acyl-CoA synthetase (AMP-forming)
VHEEFRERFGHTILERYGMSETLMLISNPYEGERRAGTVGLPLPGVSVRLGTADGGGRDAENAFVLVRGPNVFTEYWRNPAATAAAFDDGWFRTGDLAERSDEYVRAIFDQTVEACTKADAATAALGAATAPKVDPPKSRLDESLAKLAKETADLAKAGPPPGAITRK